MPRIGRLVAQLIRTLGPAQAQAEARWLKEHAPSTYARNLCRRIQGYPLQYLLGSQPFGPLDILTRPPTLIPRPETEEWTIRLAGILRGRISRGAPLRLLDLCTGTACIPLLLCHLLPPRTVSADAVDVSPSAVLLARDNVLRCGYTQPSSGNTVRVDRQDIFSLDFVPQRKRAEPAWEPYDVLTANPPYISGEEYSRLSRTVRDFEDPLALLGEYTSASSDNAPSLPRDNRHGLAFYVRIASLVRSQGLVRTGGCIALEVGQGQARAVERMFTPFAKQTEVWLDPWKVERVVIVYL